MDSVYFVCVPPPSSTRTQATPHLRGSSPAGNGSLMDAESVSLLVWCILSVCTYAGPSAPSGLAGKPHGCVFFLLRLGLHAFCVHTCMCEPLICLLPHVHGCCYVRLFFVCAPLVLLSRLLLIAKHLRHLPVASHCLSPANEHFV